LGFAFFVGCVVPFGGECRGAGADFVPAKAH
jgi:hypothetical protein